MLSPSVCELHYGLLWSLESLRFSQGLLCKDEALYGFEEPMLVGGADPEHSWLRLADHAENPPKENLAQVVFSCVVKGLTSRGPCWDVQFLPRKHKQSNCHTHLFHIGELLDACVKANNGYGPLVVAQDAHGNHSRVIAFCMGLATAELSSEAAGCPFWHLCSFESVGVHPFWPFQQLEYGLKSKKFLFITLDAAHVQKAIGRAGRSHIRKIELGAFWAPWCNMVRIFVLQILINLVPVRTCYFQCQYITVSLTWADFECTK